MMTHLRAIRPQKPIYSKLQSMKVDQKKKINDVRGDEIHYLRSSNDLVADVLIMRMAGLPGSISPSMSFPSHKTLLHDAPKVSFTCLQKASTSWLTPSGSLAMHVPAGDGLILNPVIRKLQRMLEIP